VSWRKREIVTNRHTDRVRKIEKERERKRKRKRKKKQTKKKESF
jgi:hypothetical protein